jgi:ABC-type nickel/cobalt efflux system permease component RcnA
MRAIICGLLALAAVSLFFVPAHAAQPFAGPTQNEATEAAPPSGFANSLLYRAMALQQDYFRSLAKAFRAFNLEHSLSAAASLIALSFAYGIFHAVGPGHGKVIVTSYLLADERDIRRGIALAFLSSLAQAVTAIIVVGVLAVALGFTHRAVADAVPLIERASFLLVIGVGAYLIWRALKPAHRHDHDHHHDHHGHDHHGHAHMPTPQTLRHLHGWRDMLGVILAVGLRPCTGAILVLLFALTQGAFLVGALSAFAMSIGTAITVSTLAILTLASKAAALRLAGTADNVWTGRIELGLKLAGGLFILITGILLLAGSFLMPANPLL